MAYVHGLYNRCLVNMVLVRMNMLIMSASLTPSTETLHEARSRAHESFISALPNASCSGGGLAVHTHANRIAPRVELIHEVAARKSKSFLFEPCVLLASHPELAAEGFLRPLMLLPLLLHDKDGLRERLHDKDGLNERLHEWLITTRHTMAQRLR